MARIDGAACDKATSFLALCDSYNIPLVFLVDQPGFLIGLEAERNKVAGKIINWMNALALVTVPKVDRDDAQELRAGLRQHGGRVHR